MSHSPAPAPVPFPDAPLHTGMVSTGPGVAPLTKAIQRQTRMIIGAMIIIFTSLSGIVFFIARNVH